MQRVPIILERKLEEKALEMKKIIYAVVSVLQMALLTGAYVFNYFTVKKLGMNRFVNGYNVRWKNTYPLEMLEWIAIMGIGAMTILLLVLFIKKKEKQTLEIKLSAIIMVVLSFVYIGFTLLKNVEQMRSYYFLSIMLALAALLQIMKLFIRLFKKDK